MRRTAQATGLVIVSLLVGALLAAVSANGAVQAHRHYHDGVFGPAVKFCSPTARYTPSAQIRTRIVRHSDGWSNTIHSRYHKYNKCTARQMTSSVWCTTRLVDGFSAMCITPQPRASGASPCPGKALDVRGVYFPSTGRLKITCVNQ